MQWRDGSRGRWSDDGTVEPCTRHLDKWPLLIGWRICGHLLIYDFQADVTLSYLTRDGASHRALLTVDPR